MRGSLGRAEGGLASFGVAGYICVGWGNSMYKEVQHSMPASSYIDVVFSIAGNMWSTYVYAPIRLSE